MNEKGFTLIDSLLFLSIVLLIVSYMFYCIQIVQKIRNMDFHLEIQYEEAYK